MEQIRGSSIHSERVTGSVKSLALIIDWSIALALGTCAALLAHFVPVFEFGLFGLSLAAALICAAAARGVTGRTLGEWILDLRPLSRASRVVYCRPTGGSSRLAWAGATIGASILFFSFVVAEVWLEHPLYLRARVTRIDPFMPTQQDQWEILPLYYAMGAWPNTFRGQPVLFSLTYQKGPPAVFIDHVTARWEYPEVVVVAEGPKTPLRLDLEGPEPDAARRVLRECLESRDARCQAMRRLALLRHIDEMRANQSSRGGIESWSLRWFVVPNGGLEARQESQGFYIKAQGPNMQEERYVFVTPKGAHQALILRAPANNAPGSIGSDARTLFHQLAASQRVSDNLAQGRIWSQNQLRDVTLGSVQEWRDWARTLTRLLARTTVSPDDGAAYYHLAGTAHLALKKALQGQPQWVRPLAETIQSAFRYSEDLASSRPQNSLAASRARELQNLALDADKALRGELQ